MKKLFSILIRGIQETWYMLIDLLTDKADDGSGSRKISLGRCCFLVLFFVSLKIWLGGADIAANMLIVLGSLLTYVFGTKITEGWGALTKLRYTQSDIVTVDPEEAGD